MTTNVKKFFIEQIRSKSIIVSSMTFLYHHYTHYLVNYMTPL